MWLTKFIPNNLLERALKIVNIKYLYLSGAKKNKIIFSIIRNKHMTINNYVLSNYGVWMSNTLNDKTFKLSVMGYRNGLEKFLSGIDLPMIFIDIGANQGVFSLVAAKNKNFHEIHAFEPNLNLISILEKNFLYTKNEKFFIHPFAVSSAEGEVNFFVPENHSGIGKISKNVWNSSIKSVNRNYLNNTFTNISYPFFIKIDAEGSETEILYELFNSNLSLNIKYIFIELNSIYGYTDLIVKILKRNGFHELFRKTGSISSDALYAR